MILMNDPFITMALFAAGIWLGFELRDLGVQRWLDDMQRENDELRDALMEKME